MKKLYTVLMASACSASAIAQHTNTRSHAESQSPRWAIDANLLGGFVNQSFEMANTMGNYPNAVNSNTGQFKYKDGYSYGADVQLGYFFGKSRHFGLGAGVLVMQQHGVATLSDFKVEYRATDGAGNIYRQSVKGNGIKEDITSTNVNIPIMLKYKNRFAYHWGFSVDAGALVNLQMKNAYKTEASFDQEAVYKFVRNSDGGTASVYDNASTPSSNDWLITKAEFQQNNPNGNWREYASTKRAMGINVGDGMSSGSRTGSKSYTAGSIGLMVQPSFNYYLSDNTALNLGAYYMLQPFKSEAQSGYKVTDGNGSYSSGLNNVTTSTNSSYGLNVGARFFIGRMDRDHDGVADRKDNCPDVFGLTKFHGCPDTDKDGVPDSEDSCATVFGLAKFHGCPDTDGDGIIDKYDECPAVAGTIALHGCPDRDGDGIADKKDKCPDVFGLAQFNGCPDTDGDGIADNEDKCPLVAGPASNGGCPIEDVKTQPKSDARIDIQTPMLFEVNRAVLQPASLPVIEEAVDQLNENRKATITIDGHADASGPEPVNVALSNQRAKAVKEQLVQRGISPARLKTKGHGSSMPAAGNDTYQGKQQNRRAGMKITPSQK
jgi:outer membrane protein OmpA-like peptidoglycan-associated protein